MPLSKRGREPSGRCLRAWSLAPEEPVMSPATHRFFFGRFMVHFRLMLTMAQISRMNQGSRNSPTHVQTSHLESSIAREAFERWGQDDSVVSYFRFTRNSDLLAGF